MTIINMRRVVLLLPVYVVLMLLSSAFFSSTGLTTRDDLPLWLVVSFTVMSVAVFLIVARFLAKKARGECSAKRERVYVVLLIAFVVSGFLDDALKALTALIFHSGSIWIMIPMYVLSYVALLAVVVVALKALSNSEARLE